LSSTSLNFYPVFAAANLEQLLRKNKKIAYTDPELNGDTQDKCLERFETEFATNRVKPHLECMFIGLERKDFLSLAGKKV